MGGGGITSPHSYELGVISIFFPRRDIQGYIRCPPNVLGKFLPMIFSNVKLYWDYVVYLESMLPSILFLCFLEVF
jgi:hypothetical protein